MNLKQLRDNYYTVQRGTVLIQQMHSWTDEFWVWI